MDLQDFLCLCVIDGLAVFLTVLVVRLGSLDQTMLSLVVTLKQNLSSSPQKQQRQRSPGERAWLCVQSCYTAES